jgi:hypothetical protein|tara:strand:+ start:164 stop:343 length:180 start_codon:yes stop_codon:yes gene_type:complete
MAKTVNKIASGKAIACHSQSNAGNYYSFPTDEDITAFTAKGLTLVDEQELTQFITDNYY